MKIESIDYQTKVIDPTKQLYHQLSSQANTLYENAKESAIELHAKVSESSQELYNNPSETATRWQGMAYDKGNELYVTFNNEVVPTVKADYQQLVVNMTNYSAQAQESLQFFLDHPDKVTVEAFTSLNQALLIFIDRSLDASSLMLNAISNKGAEIINLLIEEPTQTLEDIYYQTLASLLNSYFDMVSSMIQVV